MAETNERRARLERDLEVLTDLATRFDYFDVKPLSGQPPTCYEMIFRLPGYISPAGGISSMHKVVMNIPREYPRGSGAAPRFDFTSTPVFHPNVAGSGWVCLGFGHIQDWHFGYRIEDLVYQIADIIIFGPGSFNLRSQARSRGDWPVWISAHRTPLYAGALFPDPTRRPLKKKNVKPQIRVRSVKQKAEYAPSAAADPQPAVPAVRTRQVLRPGK